MIFNRKMAKWDKVISNTNHTITIKEKRRNAKKIETQH